MPSSKMSQKTFCMKYQTYFMEKKKQKKNKKNA